MLFDSINLKEGSQINNATIDSGTSFPSSPSIAELFFRTDNPNEGLYVYDGTVWSLVGQGGTVDLDGLNVKAAARAATTTNITLSGLQTIDGVALFNGDRVLVKNQSTASQNGIYQASSSSWVRTSDFDGSPATEVKAGDFVFVTEGTTQGDTGWVLTTNGTITIGTTALTFSQFTGANAVPGGVTNSLQYNSAGVFAGGTNLTWNNSTKTMSIGADLGDGTTHVQIGNATDSASGIHFRPRGPGYAYISVDEGFTAGTDLYIAAGNALQTGSQPGGNLTLSAGKGGPSSGGSNAGASVYIEAGTRGSSNGVGGSIVFRGGNGASVVEQARIANTGAVSFGSSGSAFGTSGQVLTSSGSGASPTWQTLADPSSTLLSGNNTWTGTNSFTASLFSIGSTGGSNRIQADFTSSGGARTFFQTSVLNGQSNMGVITNGTGARSSLALFNVSSLSGPFQYGQLTVDTTSVRIDSGHSASTILPITFSFQNVETLRVLTTGAVSFGSSGTATGTAGQVLTSAGAGASPTWETPVQQRLERVTTFDANARGKRVALSAGITVPSGTYAAGDAFSFYNQTDSAITITQGAGLTLRLDGTLTTGSRTLAARGTAFLWFNSASEAILSGSVT